MSNNAQSASTNLEENADSNNSFSHRTVPENIQPRYGDLIDSLPLIIYVCEPHPPYAPAYVSKGIEMIGYAPDDVYNMPDFWDSLIHEEDRERILRSAKKDFSEKKAIDHEYRIYARDGSVYWVHDKAHLVYDGDGEPVRCEGFLLDITKRKLAEAEGKKIINAAVEKSLDGSKKILLVEDENIIREMMREILSNEGYEVTTAENGVEALRICETGYKKFDLLITDFEMPQMNGRELAEKIRASSDSTKILFVSGYAGDDNFLRNLSNDGQSFVAKPFSPDSFTEKVKAVLDED